MNIMSLDLEMNQPSGTIIQVGIAVGNLDTGSVLLKYQSNVHTKETIASYITDLTKVTQQDVDDAPSLGEVYQDLIKIHTKFECFRNPLTWGGGDSELLRSSLGLDDEMFLFGRRWIDAKTVFLSYQFAQGGSHRSGLARSLRRMDLSFIGTKHTAADDAYNTFRIYHKLLGEMKK